MRRLVTALREVLHHGAQHGLALLRRRDLLRHLVRVSGDRPVPTAEHELALALPIDEGLIVRLRLLTMWFWLPKTIDVPFVHRPHGTMTNWSAKH